MVLITIACLAGGSAFGAGFSIFEQGAKASGMAGAFAATADDPSALFYNPAGLAQQREMTVLAGATFINFTNEFSGDPNDPLTSGTEGKYARHTFIPPNAYVAIPFAHNLTLGVGAFSAWGLRTDWADPWVGRFAIGGGVEYRRARVILSQNIALPFPNPFTGRITDIGNARLSSDYGDDTGFNIGVLFKPTDRVRIGLTYRSPMDIDLEGKADFTQISTGNAQLDALVSATFPHDDTISTTLPFPAIYSAGIAFGVSDKVDVEFDITHMTWSRFQALTVNFTNQPARSFTRPQNWEDSSCYRLGANIEATEKWDVRLGLLYDVNPQPTEAVGPLLPDSDRVGATFGFGFHHGPWIADVAAFILHFKDRSTEGRSADFFNGTYQTDATLWSVNLGYRF
jgi:long-chain fatty acid transport protein